MVARQSTDHVLNTDYTHNNIGDTMAARQSTDHVLNTDYT